MYAYRRNIFMTFSHTPYLVAVIRGDTPHDDCACVTPHCASLIEFRADMCATFNSTEMCKTISYIQEKLCLPIVFTLRDAKEGGHFDGNDSLREQIITDVLPYVDGVDIEFANARVFQKLAGRLKQDDKFCILSYHSFDDVPDDDSLDDMIDYGEALGADVIKIAAMCSTSRESLRLLSLPLRHSKTRIAVIGMGAFGPALRIVAPRFGSVLGYAPAREAVAPGQISLEDLSHCWSLIDIE